MKPCFDLYQKRQPFLANHVAARFVSIKGRTSLLCVFLSNHDLQDLFTQFSTRCSLALAAHSPILQTPSITTLAFTNTMFSIARVFIAFHAAAYLALVGLAPALSLALAKPFPMPMMMARNHSTSLDEPEAGPRSKTTKTPFNSSSLHSKPASPAPRTLLPFFMRSVYPRQDDGISELVLALGPYMTAANNHADTLRTSKSLFASTGIFPLTRLFQIHALHLVLTRLQTSSNLRSIPCSASVAISRTCRVVSWDIPVMIKAWETTTRTASWRRCSRI